MRELSKRSGSQMMRAFLPEQTVDLNRRVYQVTEWKAAEQIEVDRDMVRRRLRAEIYPWTVAGKDNGMDQALLRGASVEVVKVNDRYGVTVGRFPRVWLCNGCRRIGKNVAIRCRCGVKDWTQLHYLGVHECGRVTEPWIRRCQVHDDVRLDSAKSAKAADIRFTCPECRVLVQQGLGFNRKCSCGDGVVRWNVHKARMVYTPRTMVLINPPDPERMRELERGGGARQALVWVVDGLVVPAPSDVDAPESPEQALQKLLDMKIPREMAEMAVAARPAVEEHPADRLPAERRDNAEQGAVDIAMALAEGHRPVAALVDDASAGPLAERYRTRYPEALARAGIDGLDLVDKFPVLQAAYGYTRGEDDPSRCTIVPFREGTKYRLYGYRSDTEAFLIRLDPVRVANWLADRGHQLPDWSRGDTDPRKARLAVLADVDIPHREHKPSDTPGSDLLKLIHTYAHRFIRQAAVLCGIDRDALSEYLLPGHLAFFVYAAARGDFVLGGMQAVFESNLDDLLTEFVDAEHRCPLDPGCARGSGACSACVHLGEPSCRYFNRFLDRRVLFDQHGYLRR